MNDEELFEWYKNGAQRQEGMSDKQYETYKNNALYAQKNQLLDSNLSTQQAGLAQGQKSAQQSASISNDKIMKYLGQAQLASGVATGQTGTNFINANNAYQQNRAAINSNYSAQQADLLQRYAGEKLQIGSDAFNSELGILDKYYGREYQAGRDAITDERYADETAYSRERDALGDSRYDEEVEYNRGRDTVADNRYDQEYSDSRSDRQSILDMEEAANDFMRAEANFNTALESYMADGKLDDEERSLIEAYLEKNDNGKGQLRDVYETYLNSSEQSEKSKTKYGDFTSEDIRASTKGDNFSISFNGGTYTNLEVGSSAPSEITDAAKDIPGNSIFICNGKIYVKTASGGVRQVGGSGKDGVDNTGGKEGTRQYNNLYAALERAGYTLEL